jgi:DNA-directed RNA polymerase subunit RPC12/RpoP
MSKFGEESTDTTKDKTAEERICPKCKGPLEELEGTSILVCANCGHRPYEKAAW